MGIEKRRNAIHILPSLPPPLPPPPRPPALPLHGISPSVTCLKVPSASCEPIPRPRVTVRWRSPRVSNEAAAHDAAIAAQSRD